MAHPIFLLGRWGNRGSETVQGSTKVTQKAERTLLGPRPHVLSALQDETLTCFLPGTVTTRSLRPHPSEERHLGVPVKVTELCSLD